MPIEIMINILQAFKRYVDFMNSKGHDETIKVVEEYNGISKAFGECESLIVTMCGHMGETYKLRVYISNYSDELCIVDVASGSHLFERIDFINEYGLTKEEYNYVIMGK